MLYEGRWVDREYLYTIASFAEYVRSNELEGGLGEFSPMMIPEGTK